MHPRWFGNHHRFLTDPSSDAALLGRYHEDRDPAAFECLVWRHSGLVLGTCERMLRDQHLAEDAYQATFLILARKAGTVHGVLPAWLHKVARRVCLRLRKKVPLPLESDVPARAVQRTIETDETAAILDTEIARLPEKLRRVIVLCYLQNLTAEAAAQQLSIPRGTVLSRLDTARRKLQAALTRRGVAPLALLAIPLVHTAPAVALVQATRRAVLEFSSSAVTTPITELATEVLHMTTRKWITGTALAIMLIAGTTTGVGLFTANGPGTSQVVAQAPTVPTKPAVAKPAEDAQKVEILKQMQQLDKTEGELRQRISILYGHIAKEQLLRDAEVSAPALIQAIDKIDKDILIVEEGLPNIEKQLAGAREQFRPKKDYSIGFAELNSGKATGKYDSVPEVKAFLKARLSNQISIDELVELDELGTQKIKDLFADRNKLVDEFETKTMPRLFPSQIEKRRQELFNEHESYVEKYKNQLEELLKYPKTVSKRRTDLVERLRRVTGISETQKLLDDELQVLREFHKTVLKQKLTLKLELDGVKLPGEPQK